MFWGYLALKFTHTLFHTKTYFFTLFNKKTTPKNRYTRKKPTHFSMTP